MYEFDYINSKIRHMTRMGIQADRGPLGGACPKWLKEWRKAHGINANRVDLWAIADHTAEKKHTTS